MRCLSCKFLFAVCQRSSFNASLSESECKGTATLRAHQIFQQLFLKEMKEKEVRDKNAGDLNENESKAATKTASKQA